MMRSALILLGVALFFTALARDAFDRWVDATTLPSLALTYSTETRDRNDTLLRVYMVENGRWRLKPPTLDAVDPRYLQMLIAYEDKRFYEHNGIDPIALMRSGWQALLNGRIVSGGSTLSMQVARLVEKSGTGSWQGKLRQMRVALALERRITKPEILSLYLSLAPFGGNLEGVRAASLAYFGKEPSRLSAGEAALLVALPQSPEGRRPDLHPDDAKASRNRILRLLSADGLVTLEELETARLDPVPLQRLPFPALAAHLSDRAVAEAPQQTTHRLSIDARLQTALENLTGTALMDRDPQLSIAIIVADHHSGEILASVGSPNYTDTTRAGFVDMTRALRSPGSTLKPFVYALAFDRGIAHPATLINDSPVDFGNYAPQNFDGLYRGQVRVSDALRTSLNIPAVLLLSEIGPSHLMTAMREGGADPVVPRDQAGLAVVLGGLGISLHDLVSLYAGIAQGGVSVPLSYRYGVLAASGGRFLGEAASAQVASILSTLPSPFETQEPGFAYKTGTSYGSRDALAIGFDGRHVAGVWIGRADGSAVPGAFGAEFAAPVLFEVFQRLKPHPEPLELQLAMPSAGALTLPERLLVFRPSHTPAESGGPNILFPPQDAELLADGAIPVRMENGEPPFIWLVNGELADMQSQSREVFMDIETEGFIRLTVLDAKGASDSTSFWISTTH